MEGGSYEELIDVIVSRYSINAQIPSTLLQGQQRSIYIYIEFGISIDGVIMCWWSVIIVPELLFNRSAFNLYGNTQKSDKLTMFVWDHDGKNIILRHKGAFEVQVGPQKPPWRVSARKSLTVNLGPHILTCTPHKRSTDFFYVLYTTYTAFRHPNTSWEGVLGMFGGSKYLLRMCLDT